MSKADRASTTRRILLAEGAALAGLASGFALLAGSARGAPAAEHPDAELLRLGAAFDRAWRGERTLTDSLPEHWTVQQEALVNEAAYVTGLIVELIVAQPARTLDGLLVKARCVRWCHAGDDIPFELFGSTDLRMSGSIAADLGAMADIVAV